MSRVWAAVLTALVVLSVAGAGWWFGHRPPPPDRPNVIVFTLDTTRADHLRSYGYFRTTMPFVDGLARRAYTFTNAWAPMATTLPSHTSLFTGTWPLEHGVLANIAHGGRRTLPSDAVMPIPTLFGRAGYRTSAFSSAAPLAPGTGIERGFAQFDGVTAGVRRARSTADSAINWLRHNGAVPFFLWVHFYDPHGPYIPPGGFDTFDGDRSLTGWMEDRGISPDPIRNGGDLLDPIRAHDAYDGELAYTDFEIERILSLLDRRGWADRTAIVIVADHGEGLGQHGIPGHGQVWREQLQVPLLIYLPWQEGTIEQRPISMVDVMPTLLGLIDVPGERAWLAQASGHDVFRQPVGPMLGTTSLRQENLVGTPAQRALTVGLWRWLDLGESSGLFELRSDPHEQVDLAPVLPFHRALFARWTQQVHDGQEAHGRALGTGATVDVSPEEQAALEALGYVE